MVINVFHFNIYNISVFVYCVFPLTTKQLLKMKTTSADQMLCLFWFINATIEANCIPTCINWHAFN